MRAGQYVRRADGTIWQVAHIGTTIRTLDPRMTGEEIGELRLHREGHDVWVLSYGAGQATRLGLPPAEILTPVDAP